jgi:AmmeMemoRadiSam system protein A
VAPGVQSPAFRTIGGAPVSRTRAEESQEGEPLTADLRATLLALARRSIETRLADAQDAAPDAEDFPPALRARRSSFVTLERGGELRGCIGSLEATTPLVEDVWRNARQAAFQDARFEPLAAEELTDLHVHIEVLGPLESMHVTSDEDLLARLRPGRDGLVIQCPGHRATFLPAVWQKLPEPADFLHALKRKAGLSTTHSAGELTVSRYATESFEEPA